MQVAYGGLKGEGASRFVFLRGPGGIFRVLELIRLRAGDRAVKTTRLSPECHPRLAAIVGHVCVPLVLLLFNTLGPQGVLGCVTILGFVKAPNRLEC